MDFDELVKGLFPALKGETFDLIRKGIAYQLISIGKSEFFRDSIHILLLGNPGTGKTHILRYVSKIPGCLYVFGQTITIAGLLGGITYGELRKGVVHQVNGVLCFDEIDKTSTSIKNSMNELMENLTVTITKGTERITYNTNLAILASANPKGGYLSVDQDYIDQIDLPPTLIDRFDLIYVIQKPAIMSLEYTEEYFLLDTKELELYLNKVRSINPKIKNYKIDIPLSGSDKYFTVRRYNTIIRLAKAIARSYEDTEVKENYVEEAIKFFTIISNRLLGYIF